MNPHLHLDSDDPSKDSESFSNVKKNKQKNPNETNLVF